MLDFGQMFQLNPMDILIGAATFFIGSFSAKRNRAKGFTVLLQISILLYKMAKFYYDQHPEARNNKDSRLLKSFDNIYEDHLEEHDKQLKISSETGATG